MFNPFMLKSTHELSYRMMRESLRAENLSLRDTNYALDRTAAKFKSERDAARNSLGNAQAALTDIAGMVTPNCAHIGKRMAARAERGLGAPSALHGAPVLKAVG